MGKKLGYIWVLIAGILIFRGPKLWAQELPQKEVIEQAEVQKCKIEYEKPNGKNEYYTKKPSIKLTHREKGYISKYILEKPNQELLQGELKEEYDEGMILEGEFQEGMHKLSVWLEDSSGRQIDQTEEQVVFKIDTVAPRDIFISYGSEREGEQIYYNEESYVYINAHKEDEDISGIYYQLDGDAWNFTMDCKVGIAIKPGFQGKLSAYSIDRAGNKSRSITSKEMICDTQKPNIQLETPHGFHTWYDQDVEVAIHVTEVGISSGIQRIRIYMNKDLVLHENIDELEVLEYQTKINVRATSINDSSIPITVEVIDRAGNQIIEKQYLQVDKDYPIISVSGVKNHQITSNKISCNYEIKDDNYLADIQMIGTYESIDGSVAPLEPMVWIANGTTSQAEIELVESGKYRLEVRATDKAGHSALSIITCIIDRENPIIRYVNELQGTFLQYFQWNYEMDHVIQDFTSYTYIMELDGKLYPAGEKIEREGIHYLTVQATDAAGNESKVKAEFVIDHTRPQMMFQNITQGGIYEGGIQAIIELEDESDIIDQIIINGKKETLNKKNRWVKRLEEPKKYVMEIIAKDQANNKSKANITFEIIEPESKVDKFIKPFINIVKNKSHPIKIHKKKYHYSRFIIMVFIGTSVGIICIIKAYKKRKK